MKSGAPPISTISVRMPRDLATHLESPKSTQSGSLSFCAISEAKLESTKSSHDVCMPSEYGSREGSKKPLRLPSEKHEALNQSHFSGVLTSPPQGQTSPRKTAGDSSRIEMDSIGKRTTTEFFQQASIHGHADSPTLRVVTVQGGYCIDSRDCNSRISVCDEENSSMVFRQAPEYESLGNHRGSGRELNRELHISKTQLERSSNRIQGMENDHQELVSAHRELKGEMTERITSTQQQCLSTSSSFEAVMQEATKYKADVQALQDDLKDLNDCRAYLSKKQEELARSFLEIQNRRMEENQTLISQIEELKTKCELEQSLCIKQSEEAAELRQRCEGYQLSIQQLEMDTQTQAQKISELTMDLKYKDDSIKELEIALASSKSEIKTPSDSMDTKCESLISEIRVAEDLYNELAELSRKSDTATIGVSTGDDPATDLHSLMTHLQFQLDDTEAKNDDLNKTLRLLELKQVSILGEKAKLEERLKELSALSITMKDRNEDQQTQIAEAQRNYDSILKKLADSENEKARLYGSISESLAMHGTQLGSTIQECAAQFEETRKIEAIESQNQTQKIQHQICALEIKLEEKSKELGAFAKEKEKLENELVLWRAKIQLMETEKGNQQQRALKDQDENRKYIQDLEGQVRRLQDESKEASKDLPESLTQTIQQVRSRI
ncbi:hypothetical protein BGZ80_003638 [Entomortierella chlamydospora]|uniref:Uncharacterized protein n=1 Tax=Entomortierella chlamydospora TaxID=101097 RepID=A0A9P6N0P1_9FUNG|nr:hypothetical protein BGZ80_003638 [Entomortierella chlamydospora]